MRGHSFDTWETNSANRKGELFCLRGIFPNSALTEVAQNGYFYRILHALAIFYLR